MEEDSDLDDDLMLLAGRGKADAGPSSGARKRQSNAVLSDDDDDDDAGARKRKQKKREVRRESSCASASLLLNSGVASRSPYFHARYTSGSGRGKYRRV